MDIRKQIAKNTALQLTNAVLNVLLGIYALALIGRYLEKEMFGRFGFITSFFVFFISMLDFGTYTVGIREVSGNTRDNRVFLSQLLGFKVCLSFVLFVSVFISSFVLGFSSSLRQSVLLYSPILLLMSFETIQIVLQANLKYEFIVVASLVWRVISIAGIILSIQLNAGLNGIILSFVIAELSRCLILTWAGERYIHNRLFFGFDMRVWKEICVAAIPIGITSVLVSFIRSNDFMILTKFRGFAEVGTYNAAYRLYDVSLSLPIALIGSLLPLMSRFYKEDHRVLKGLHQKTFDVLIVSGGLLVAVFLGVGDNIIKLIFGSSFPESGKVLHILAIPSFAIYAGIGSGTMLMATNRQIVNMFIYLVACPLSFVLNYLVIPEYGVYGAAVTHAFIMSSIVVVTMYLVSNKFDYHLSLKKVPRVFVCVAVTFFTLRYARQFNTIGVLIAVVFYYALLAFITGAVAREEISFLYQIKTKDKKLSEELQK